MSSMLEQAIIDAEQLKETAKRTAEEGVVEKYQDEIKEAIEKILEQEEVVDAEVSLDGDTPELEIVEELPAVQTADSDEIVQIDLNQLEEMMAEELEEGELDPDDMLDREQVAEELEAISSEGDGIKVEIEESVLLDLMEDEVDIDIDEESLTAIIAEMLNEDYVEDAEEDDKAIASEDEAEAAQAAATGDEDTDVESLEEDSGAKEGDKGKDKDDPEARDYTDGGDRKGDKGKRGGKDYESTKKGDKKKDGGKAYKRDTRDDMGGGHGDYATAQKKPNFPYQENKQKQALQEAKLIKEQTKLSKKNQLLEERINKYGTVIKQLKEKLNESNLTNAKLLYQNRILNSVSLNERQKDKIVEAISNATTVEEAKLIFETLQSAVGVSKKKHKRPESLNEVVTRSSSAFIPRNEAQPKADAFSERMKRLAGLK